MGLGPLRGVMKVIHGASVLTYSAMVATQELLVTGRGGSQLSLTKDLAPFYWSTAAPSSNWSLAVLG